MVKQAGFQNVFATRVKQARLRAGITQMELGVKAGIDEFTASARINQYERAVHTPGYDTATRLAFALTIPVSYLYESDDKIAEIILAVGVLSQTDREKALHCVQAVPSTPKS